MFGTALTGVGGLIGIMIPLWAVLFTVGIALPNAPALALTRHGEAAGTAASVLGAVQFGAGAVVSPLVGIAGNNAAAMGAVMGTTMVLALAVVLLLVRPWRLENMDTADPALASAGG